MKNRVVLFFMLGCGFLFFSMSSYGAVLRNAPYEVCFTPGEDCQDLIVSQLEKAKKSIFVQAYSFTSAPIAKAIVDAAKRGVEVEAILDKSQFSVKYSSSRFLLNHKIMVWKDDKVAIAHNKVIIIDKQTVITGSFNFTKAAQEKNAENLIVIEDKDLAKKYITNWEERRLVSTRVQE
jgi:phosphatidylserine/phosphatidylglycerophosphate/cardiolipin synthase-like enzyme